MNHKNGVAVMRKYIFLIVFFFPLSIMAQDVKTLTTEFETLFSSLHGSERKELVATGVEVWTSSFLSNEEKTTLHGVLEQLQVLRMPVNPDIASYLRCINVFQAKNERENLHVWLDGLVAVLESKQRRKNDISSYLQATSRIVCDGVLFVTSTHKWIGRGKYTWSASPDMRVDIKGGDIVCKTLKDSIFIHDVTEAGMDVMSSKLYGKGGRVWWNSNTDSLFTNLRDWQIDMTQSEYTADSVDFIYEKRFAHSILGKIHDNASKYSRVKAEPFPAFSSYSIDIKIDSIFPCMFFRGGVSYEGMKFTGFGTESSPACVHITPNDTIHFYAYSQRFQIDSSRILGNTSHIKLPLDKGVFSHSDVNFAYTADNNTVYVKRITEQSLNTPFKDDYHQILFNVEKIEWNVDSIYMDMSMNNRSGLMKAQVESFNFFSVGIYDKMQEMDDIHPLNALQKVGMELKSNTFTLDQYAEKMRLPVDQLRKQLIILSYKDFLEYDEKRDAVTLKQRLFDYTSARVGRKDYDDICFDSHPLKNEINARLNLKNYDLRIFGVEKFTISKAKDIYVEPVDHAVVMKKNRDMEFNGKLKAGMFDMYGTNLYFSYDKYKIDLTHVDSTGMYLADKQTGKRGIRLNSKIMDITGDILIDKPGNKSGSKANEGFPVFNSTQKSYVYFDDKSIRNGVYKRDSFYFVVEPYTLKDINQGDKFRYAFNGTLVSNIVPDIVDTLLLMKDNTLGMRYKSPDRGITLYDRGNIVSRFSLDQNGFIADGRVSLNSSNFQSKEIILYPDSMLAQTPLLKVQAITSGRPNASGEQIGIRYFRSRGRLQAVSSEKPFEVYDNRVKHEGTLFVYDNTMDASGMLKLKSAILHSKLFNMKANNILSASTDLSLASFANQNIQLNTSDVRTDIDMVANKGTFTNNVDANQAEFPASRYRCTFKSFTWYMDKDYLNIGIEDERELARLWRIETDSLIPVIGRNVFVSTDKKTDSLRFIAPLAKYDLKTGDIDCQWVNHIDMANARFYPDKGNIYIGGTGDIREFTNSRLLCERTDSTKQLNKVTLKLTGRHKFNGSGDFIYISEEKVSTVIRFIEMGVDSTNCFYAKADIAADNAIGLNKGFNYKGNIYLYSRKPDLFFRGYVALTTPDTYLKHTWLRVNTFLNSKQIRIPVDVENRNDANQRIFNGIYLNVDKTTRPYAAFQSSREFYNDDLVLGGKGILAWSGLMKTYSIKDTLRDDNYHVSYNPQREIVSAYGNLDFNMTCPGVVQRQVGNISYNLKEEQLQMDDVLYSVDFTLLKKMEAVMLKDFTEKKKNMTVGYSLVNKLSTIYGKPAMPGIMKQLGHNGNNIPDSLGRLLVLDSLSFTWNPEFKAYYADGEVNVLAFRKKPSEKIMNVKMALVRRRVGDELYIYLYDDKLWYYFEYTGKTLFTLSSNEEYNTILQNEKAENKIIRDKNKLELYTITLCPDSKRQRFLKRAK